MMNTREASGPGGKSTGKNTFDPLIFKHFLVNTKYEFFFFKKILLKEVFVKPGESLEKLNKLEKRLTSEIYNKNS